MIIHVLGITCAGKDTLMEYIASNYEGVGLVQVGKEMRKRHPPEYFKGLGAMQSTEEEVRQIYCEQYGQVKHNRLVLVSSQPRLISQVSFVYEVDGHRKRAFLFIRASDAEINHRVNERFPNWRTDESHLKSRELSLQRINNDRIQNYDTILEIISQGDDDILVYDTEDVSVMARRLMDYVTYRMNH